MRSRGIGGERTRTVSRLLFPPPASHSHETGAHPERVERIEAIEAALGERDWLGGQGREAPGGKRSTLEAVPPGGYVQRIESISLRGGGYLDMDTVLSSGSWECALHSTRGAVAMGAALLTGEARYGASVHRPPGHHAEAARGMGFCLFNHVAVAARHALDAHGAGRVLIVDWDVHHGNGTNDIFHATDEVLFCSIHQSPLYPGTGPAGDVGSGAGAGFTGNTPGPGRPGGRRLLLLAGRARRRAARARVPPAPRARLGRLRRPPRRSAGELRVHGGGLR